LPGHALQKLIDQIKTLDMEKIRHDAHAVAS
jgi:hypothetical protein